MKKLVQLFIIFALVVIASKFAFGQAASNQPAAAQPSTTRRWYHVVENNLKLGALNDYAELRVKERIPALKKGGVKRQEVWTSVIGEGGKLFTVEPLEGLGMLDRESPLTKALGAEGARALAAKTQQYFVEGGHSYITQSRPELSWTAQMTTPPKYAVVARVKVARGRRADFEDYIKNDHLPIVKKSGALGYTVFAVAYGANVSEYITSTFFNSFADIEKSDPAMTATQTRVLGEAAAQKLMQKTVGVIIENERNILRYRPEWSILP